VESGSDTAWLVVHHPDGTRHHHRLTLALTTLGRSDQNVIEVLDAKLSRFHCEVERRGGLWLIRDCNSRNGTAVNGEALTSARPLRDRDKISIGRTTVEFTLALPEDLRSDPAMALAIPASVAPGAAPPPPPLAPLDRARAAPSEDDEPVEGEAPTSIGRRTSLSFDPRQTMRVEASIVPRGPGHDPWKVVARAALEGLDATNRTALIERAIVDAKDLLQARGVMLVLAEEKNPDALSVTAALGLDRDGRERCFELARRVVGTRERVIDDRRALGVPLRGRRRVEGALVLHDLPGTPAEGTVELEALDALATAVARTLSTSLLLEEVRREERAAHGERLAHDLRRGLFPEPDAPPVPGLDVGFARAPSTQAGRDVALRVLAPARAGRQELFLALAETPDLDAPPPERFRRRGERGFLPLLGQAELTGALRALIAVLPRTDEVLLQLDRALRAGGPAGRAAIALLRYDPTTAGLRFSGAGHAPLLLRRASGAVESILPLAPALGSGPEPRLAERELRWEKGDLLLLVSASASRAALTQGLSLGDQDLRAIAASIDPRLTAVRAAQLALEEVLRRVGVLELADAAALVMRRVP
jgi:pSer/pThr/pTyr-binding forkhead associated (FHA) protein